MTRLLNAARRCTVAATSIALAATQGCSDRDAAVPELSLRDESAPHLAAADAEAARLRQLSLVKYELDDTTVEQPAYEFAEEFARAACAETLYWTRSAAGDADVLGCATTGMEPHQQGYCLAFQDPALDATPRLSPCIAQNGCAAASVFAEYASCVAHRLLEVAAVRADDVVASSSTRRSRRTLDTLPGIELRSVRVPPQETAANAAVRAMAALYAQLATSAASNALSNALSNQGNCSLSTALQQPATTPYDQPSFFEQWAAIYADSHRTFGEAIDGAVADVVAEADAQRGTSSEPDSSAARAESGAALSRAAAARLLVGGWSLPAEFSGGFCPTAAPTRQEQRAAELIRYSAIDPNLIADASTTNLLEASGGMKDRLFARWGIPAPAGTTLTEYLGLSEETFTAAAANVEREYHAFGPSRRAGPPIAGAGATAFQCFLAVERGPTRIEPQYYAALARTGLGDPWG